MVVAEARSISEAAQATGLSTHTLRYYERAGLMLDPITRAASTHRRFSDAEIDWVVFLTKLRSTGMPIRMVRRYAELVRVGTGNEAERLQLLEMEYIALGSQGLTVSRQGLGCMGMSDFYGATDDDESIATIQPGPRPGRDLLRHGRHVRSPHQRGAARPGPRRGRRDEAVIATKFGIVRDADDPTKRAINGRPEYVRQACDASLARLGVDHIDLYYQHRVDPDTPIEETVGAMGELVTRGQGALPRSLRSGAGHHPSGPRRAPDLGPADGVLGVVTRPRGRDPAHRPGARDRLRPLQPARPGLPDRHRALGRRSRRGRLPPLPAPLPG
jgi:DNA-binding transcriptional MerR regulator